MQGNRSSSSTDVRRDTLERAKNKGDRKKVEVLSQKLSDALGLLDKMESDVRLLRQLSDTLIVMSEEGQESVPIDLLLDILADCYYTKGRRLEDEIDAQKPEDG